MQKKIFYKITKHCAFLPNCLYVDIHNNQRTVFLFYTSVNVHILSSVVLTMIL